MRLPDFTDDPNLKALRRRMGASAPGEFSLEFRPVLLTQEELEQLGKGGIEVFFNEITKLDDGTLGYKNSRVLVHIRDVSTYGREIQLPKFHFSFCRTLEEMTRAHRFGRYVVATPGHERFLIQRISRGRKHERSYEQLDVCQNCLNSLSFDGFSLALSSAQRKQHVSNFKISKFFEIYPRSLHIRKPQYTDLLAPTNDYTLDFDQVSRRIKETRNYTCEECGRQPEPRFLHVHHLNGQKNDNTDGNLRVVCMGCHAKMPLHGHMKVTPGFEEFQRKYEYK